VRAVAAASQCLAPTGDNLGCQCPVVEMGGGGAASVTFLPEQSFRRDVPTELSAGTRRPCQELYSDVWFNRPSLSVQNRSMYRVCRGFPVTRVQSA
jgi:hypothetical protein